MEKQLKVNGALVALSAQTQQRANDFTGDTLYSEILCEVTNRNSDNNIYCTWSKVCADRSELVTSETLKAHQRRHQHCICCPFQCYFVIGDKFKQHDEPPQRDQEILYTNSCIRKYIYACTVT